MLDDLAVLSLLPAAPFMALDVAVALLIGGVLGTLFYGGLWWTTANLARFRQPWLVMLASALLRTGAALGGFWLVGEGDWRRLLVCLLGFVLARAAVIRLTRLTRLTAARPPADDGEAGHAS